MIQMEMSRLKIDGSEFSKVYQDWRLIDLVNKPQERCIFKPLRSIRESGIDYNWSYKWKNDEVGVFVCDAEIPGGSIHLEFEIWDEYWIPEKILTQLSFHLNGEKKLVTMDETVNDDFKFCNYNDYIQEYYDEYTAMHFGIAMYSFLKILKVVVAGNE